ncbi:MAG: hypothetical protein SGJ16_13865 [Nitrospirota bacterium]|nr:hypothetical protein [Nitrospirota bacterium]
MKQLILGIVVGSLLTGGLVGAASLYDGHGNVSAPSGSPQMSDYFRQRQLFLDAAHVRASMEEVAREGRLNPCRK